MSNTSRLGRVVWHPVFRGAVQAVCFASMVLAGAVLTCGVLAGVYRVVVSG